jgi:hypothetical protein
VLDDLSTCTNTLLASSSNSSSAPLPLPLSASPAPTISSSSTTTIKWSIPANIKDYAPETTEGGLLYWLEDIAIKFDLHDVPDNKKLSVFESKLVPRSKELKWSVKNYSSFKSFSEFSAAFAKEFTSAEVRSAAFDKLLAARFNPSEQSFSSFRIRFELLVFTSGQDLNNSMTLNVLRRALPASILQELTKIINIHKPDLTYEALSDNIEQAYLNYVTIKKAAQQEEESTKIALLARSLSSSSSSHPTAPAASRHFRSRSTASKSPKPPSKEDPCLNFFKWKKCNLKESTCPRSHNQAVFDNYLAKRSASSSSSSSSSASSSSSSGHRA